MNSNLKMQNTVAFLVGLLFAMGLAISGMTQPQKVIGFLDPWNWDIALMFVMLGAVAVHFTSYFLIRKRSLPILEHKWHVPTRKDITPRLIMGSALFGIGWGMGGFCPGPALTSIATGDGRVILFVGAMIVGMLLFKKTDIYLVKYLKLKE